MIYYVEDDKNIRDLVVYTLGQTEYAAQGFETPKAFWEACKKETPELVLLDIMLPEEDGMTVLKENAQNARAGAGARHHDHGQGRRV